MRTTEGPPRRPGLSVRTRITASVAGLVLVGLAVAGVVVYTIEAQRLDDQVTAEIDQELAEFAKLQQAGLDPDTDEPFTSVEQLVSLFLARNVADENEVLLGWWDDRIQVQSRSDHQISRSPWLADTIRTLLPTSAGTRIDSELGELDVSVQSVRQGDSIGALVVVTFLDQSRRPLRDTMRTYAIVSALVLLVVAAMAAWISGRLLSPLRTLRQTTEAIEETDLSLRLPVSGNDDITALTRTVNGMLDRLESAFVAQREFLDDAGHELKTPLTVLRGHLELLDAADPQEVAETRELLLDEVDRMSRLVGDLILLARSDQPDFVTVRPVDLAPFTGGLITKARALGDRRWTLDRAAEVTVAADEQRLTQAVLQLADNAVKHTHPGDEVAIGSSYDGTSVSLWVRDTGPGVSEADRHRVFERFGRAAVRPGDDGLGLGLSIVAAIARAHGGDVTVESAAPTGARFVITIPAPRSEDPWRAS